MSLYHNLSTHNAFPEDGDYISPIPSTWDATHINWVVSRLFGVIGSLNLGTVVKAPHMRKHPVTGLMRMHYGWDVVFKNPRIFTLSQLRGRFVQDYKNVTVTSGWSKGGGNGITVTLDTPADSSRPQKMSIFLCHFDFLKQVGDEKYYKQGSTGMSTGPHTHIEVRANGVIA